MADNIPSFTRIALRYKNLDAFAKAARTTFAKGRMTLRSKKDLQVCERIILSMSIPEQAAPIDIICEVIQQIPAKDDGDAHTFSVRWLNFTEKKLARLMNPVAGDETTAPPVPARPPPPPAAAKPKGAASPPVQENDLIEEVASEYIIDIHVDGIHPSFMEPPAVIVPATPEPKPEPPAQPAAPAPDPYATEELDKLPRENDAPEAAPEPDADTSLDLQVVGSAPPASKPPDHPSLKPKDTGAPPAGPAPDTEEDAPGPAGPGPEDGLHPAPETVAPPGREDLAPEGPVPASAEAQVAAPPPSDRAAASVSDAEALAGVAPAPAPTPEGERPFTAGELAALAIFLQKFLRAVLSPAWLEGETDRLKPLHEEFRELMSGRQEIGVYMRSTAKGREFLLAGDALGPVNLKAELPPAQFVELAPRLVELFSAQALIGVQFRRHLTEDNFRAFIAELGRPIRPPAELAAAFLRQGIFSASVVFEADRIDRARELDFRVDITLSRLRGDLLRLRLMAEAIQEDPSALWTLRVEDALKTVREGKLRAELLLHADLVTAGQTEITETDLVQEVVMASPVETVVEAAEVLAGQYETLFASANLAPSSELEEAKNRVRRLLRQVTARLTIDDRDAATRLMGGLYRRGVFTLEELPPELRERLMLEQFIDFFLTDPEKRTADFAAIRADRDYQNAADRYVRMIGELVRRGDLDSADRIFRTLVDHVLVKEPLFPERQQLARTALAGLGDERMLRALVFSLETVDKEKRERLAAIIFAAGKAALPPLLELLGRAEDRSLRRLLCAILTRMGPAIAPELYARARAPQSSWFLVRNLVMVLGDMKSEIVKDDLGWVTGHQNPRVREEGLVYAAKIIGADSEAMMVRGLADPDPQVRRRAVRMLARFPSLGDAAVLGLLDMLAQRPGREPQAEEEQALVAAAELAGKIGNRALADGRTTESVLTEALEAEAGRGLLSRISGSKSGRTPKIKAALIAALGKVGSPSCIKLLSSFMKDKEPAVKQSAQMAVSRLGKG